MGPAGTVFTVFIVLKLVGVIDWSWIWITSPLWIGGIIMGIMFAVGAGVDAWGRRHDNLEINQSERPSWPQRHLNWSLVLATIGTYFAVYGVCFLFGYTTPELALLSDESIEWVGFFIGLIVALAILIPTTVWFLRRKGRSLGWVGMLFVPFGLIVLLCLKNRHYL